MRLNSRLAPACRSYVRPQGRHIAEVPAGKRQNLAALLFFTFCVRALFGASVRQQAKRELN